MTSGEPIMDDIDRPSAQGRISRSPSPRRDKYYSSRRHYSRSRSPYRSHGYRPRYRSRSPSYSRGFRERRSPPRRPYPQYRRTKSPSIRDNPPPSEVLGVFGLSSRTRERDLEDMYAKFGKIRKVIMVYDKHSGLSRGFGFVTFSSIEEASEARDKTNGELLHGRRIRVDYSLTERAHSPTPGGYKGVPTSRSRRSPSPYSRSSRRRSISPRRNGDRSPSPRARRRPDSPPSRGSRRSPSPRARPAERRDRSISASPRRERSHSRSPPN